MSAASAARPRSGSSILIVDDDPQIRRKFRMLLEKAGHSVTEAGNGRQAWRILEDQIFDLLVLDLSMPEMDGFELMSAAHLRFPQAKILIVSGYLNRTLLKIAGRLGATATLNKKHAPERLRSTVRRLLER